MLIILNGPAGCGKDTIGGILHEQYNFNMLSFKSPMWAIAEASLGSFFPMFKERYNDRKLKEVPWLPIGCSPRQFFIKISEEWCKPTFGSEYFGAALEDAYSSRYRDSVFPTVVTDGGFSAELHPALAKGIKVVIVRLHRQGFSFAGDSRDYIKDNAYLHVIPAKRPFFFDMELQDGNPQRAVKTILEQFA